MPRREFLKFGGSALATSAMALPEVYCETAKDT